ncbi:MAG TPA: hypothetical protein VKY74_02240 [Chloroflexia bacterium]|nr:hypothetical protein [Chloroflexia bacterium]
MTLVWRPINPQHPAHRRKPLPAATPCALLTSAPQYVGVNISTYYFDLQGMLDLDFKGMAQYKGKLNVAFFMLEVACYTGDILVEDVRTHEIFIQRQGVGFRIAVANWGVAFSTSATLAAVAANAELNISQTGIEVQIVGAGLETLPILAPLSQMSGLSAQSLQTISQCAMALADYFEQNGSGLTPAALAVAPIPVGDFNQFNCFYSGQFGPEAIYRGKSLADALTEEAQYPQGNSYVVPSFARAVYGELNVGDGTPDPDAHALAGQILAEGRF